MKKIIIILALLSLLIFSIVWILQNRTQNCNELASSENNIVKLINAKNCEYKEFAWRWSGIYWGVTFGAAIFSALAGIWLKLDAFKEKKIFRLTQNDVSAIFAGIASILITMSSAGDFNGKWKANRTASFRSEQLKNEINYETKLTTEEIKSKLNKIIEDQNNGVIDGK